MHRYFHLGINMSSIFNKAHLQYGSLTMAYNVLRVVLFCDYNIFTANSFTNGITRMLCVGLADSPVLVRFVNRLDTIVFVPFNIHPIGNIYDSKVSHRTRGGFGSQLFNG